MALPYEATIVRNWVEKLPPAPGISEPVGLRNPIDNVSMALSPYLPGQSDRRRSVAHTIPFFLAADEELGPGYEAWMRDGHRTDLTVICSPLERADDLGPYYGETKGEFERTVARSDLVSYSLQESASDEEMTALIESGATFTGPRETAEKLALFQRIKMALDVTPRPQSCRNDINVPIGIFDPPKADKILAELAQRAAAQIDSRADQGVYDLVISKLRIMRNIGAIGTYLGQTIQENPNLVRGGRRLNATAVVGVGSLTIAHTLQRNYGVNIHLVRSAPRRTPTDQWTLVESLDTCLLDAPTLDAMDRFYS